MLFGTSVERRKAKGVGYHRDAIYHEGHSHKEYHRLGTQRLR